MLRVYRRIRMSHVRFADPYSRQVETFSSTLISRCKGRSPRLQAIKGNAFQHIRRREWFGNKSFASGAFATAHNAADGEKGWSLHPGLPKSYHDRFLRDRTRVDGATGRFLAVLGGRLTLYLDHIRRGLVPF
jgi:hypothetical protein